MSWRSINSIKIDGNPLLINIEELLEFFQKFLDPEIKTLHAFRVASILEHHCYPYLFRKNLTSPVETHNVFKLLNAYGYGNCKQIVMFMQFILDNLGIPNRVIALQNRKKKESHFVIEVSYGGKWHLFDPDLGVYFLNKSDEIISIDDFACQGFHKAEGNYNCRKWKRFIPNLNNNDFYKMYETLFADREVFDMIDNRYPWKKEFMANYGLSRWYCAEQPTYFLPESCEIKDRKGGKGIVRSQLVSSSKEIRFDNLIFTFHPQSKFFDLNNFPFPILGIKCSFQKKSGNFKGTINIRGNSLDFNITNQEDLIIYLLDKNPDLFDLPIYSFIIHSTQELKTVEITTQASPAREKVLHYIKINSR